MVLVEGDLCKYDSLRAAMQGCRACVTCAFYEVAYAHFVLLCLTRCGSMCTLCLGFPCAALCRSCLALGSALDHPSARDGCIPFPCSAWALL